MSKLKMLAYGVRFRYKDCLCMTVDNDKEYLVAHDHDVWIICVRQLTEHANPDLYPGELLLISEDTEVGVV